MGEFYYSRTVFIQDPPGSHDCHVLCLVLYSVPAWSGERREGDCGDSARHCWDSQVPHSSLDCLSNTARSERPFQTP